ncbi:MAG: DUF4434 domain-containing protein [Verrucomicrobiota bacterium]
MSESEIFRCDENLDVRLIPPGIVSENDRLEIRLQARNISNSACRLTIELFWDEETAAACLMRETLPVEPGKFGFVRCFHGVRDMAGTHQVLATLSFDGRQTRIRRKVEVRSTTGNILEGGFITISGGKDLDDAQWAEQLTAWDEIGMKTLLIFETYGPTGLKDGQLHAYYPSKIMPLAGNLKSKDPIKAILETARKNGQAVFIGLGANKNSDKNPEIIDELFGRYGRISSFYGWYAAVEHATAGANAAVCLDKTWKELRSAAGRLSPVMPILSSPYQESLSFDSPYYDLGKWGIAEPASAKLGSIRGIHPEFERYLLEHPDCLDILMPQDGVGGFRHALGPWENNRNFALFREICDKTKIHLWANCESFDYNAREFPKLVPRVLNGGFDGAAGFVQQITAVRPHVEKVLTFVLTGLFAKPGLQPETGGPAAVEQYGKYRDYHAHPAPMYRNLALGKSYVKSPEPGYVAGCFFPPDLDHRLTDGRLCGGYCYPIDDTRLIGYYFEDHKSDQLSVDITINLQAVESIDAVRCAAALRQVNGNADRITVALSNDGKIFEKLGSTCEYHNGWAEIIFDQPRQAQFVKINFFKKQPKPKEPNVDNHLVFANSWLLIDEIEVCRKMQ